MKESDRYLKLVEWSEEDGCYVGSCPGLFYGGCHGPDEAKVYKELCGIVEEVIEAYGESGRPLPPGTAEKEFSGKFMLRVGKELHRLLHVRAMQSRKSLNSYCIDVLRGNV